MQPQHVMTSIAATLAAAVAYFTLPADFPLTVVAQLHHPNSGPFPADALNSENDILVDYSDDAFMPGQGYADLTFHPLARLRPESPRLELRGGMIGRIRKPETAYPIGVRMIGFSSQVVVEESVPGDTPVADS